MQKGVILSIDDDQGLQTVLVHYLEEEGYKVLCAKNVATATETANTIPFDIILLDLTLPDGEGLSLIPLFRAKTSAPIIVVSGKDDSTEKVICLEMGADDYLTKPFEMRELSARIKAVLRRTNKPAANESDVARTVSKSDRLFFEKWCLDRQRFQLFDQDNISADLTTGEFKLMEALLLSANRTLSREQLFDLTRASSYDVYDRAIDIQIARLRKKLKDNGDIIKTVRGIGYMLTADVQAA